MRSLWPILQLNARNRSVESCTWQSGRCFRDPLGGLIIGWRCQSGERHLGSRFLSGGVIKLQEHVLGLTDKPGIAMSGFYKDPEPMTGVYFLLSPP